MSDYSITAVTRRKVYSGSAGVGPYAFTFPVLVQTDLAVYKNSTKLTLTTDYTVTINGTNGTGSVTLVVAATSADTITIIGARAIQRTTDFVTAGDLAASSLNEQLDANIIMTQQLAEENKRTLRAPPYDPESVEDGGTLDMTLPAKADRAGKTLAFDADGNPTATAAALPSALTATNYPRVNAAGTAYELRAPATVRSDIGADNASNLTSGTVADARLPSTMAGKTLTSVTISSGTITGITDLAVADGGTGASSAAAARSNLSAAVLGANNDITSMTGVTGGISSPDFIQFDTAATVTDATARLYYDNEDQFQTLAFQMNGSVVHKVGEERYYRVKLTANATKGQVLMFTGTIGASGGLTAAPATGLTSEQSSYILGIAAESGSTNDWIFVTEFGEVKQINTTGGAESWVQGDVLYYNPAVTGGLTKIKPSTPNAIAIMAAVVNVGSSNGIVFVRPTFGSVLGGTDGNVQFGTLNNGDYVVYNSTNQRWENQQFSVTTPFSIPGTASATGEIRLAEDTDNGTNYVGLKAPASISTNLSWTLPAADGTSGQFLSTDGSGALSWSSPAGGGDVVGPASSTDNAIVRFDLTSGKAIQNSGVTIADDNATVISGSSSSNMLRITQTGAGNALLVEDSTNPDSTPFVVDANGKVIQGHTASIGFARSTTGGTAATNSPNVQVIGTASGTTQLGTYLYSDTTATAKAGVTLARSRGADTATRGALVSGDAISGVEFVGDNGTAMAAAATVFGAVDGTPSSDMPGRLVFSTTAAGSVSPTERMRIDSAGQVRIGAGTAAAPALSTLNDTNTGIFFPAADTLAFAEGGTEIMRISSAGYVGIGTNNPQSQLEIGVASGAGTLRFSVAGSLQGSVFASTASMAVGTFANTPLVFNTNNTERARITETGDFQFNSGYGSVAVAYGCRAWVNFDGTTNTGGNCTIRASGNVSTVADNGTGDYTINFSTTLPDANYAFNATVGRNTTANSFFAGQGTTAPTTTALRIQVRNDSGTLSDAPFACVSIFR